TAERHHLSSRENAASSPAMKRISLAGPVWRTRDAIAFCTAMACFGLSDQECGARGILMVQQKPGLAKFLRCCITRSMQTVTRRDFLKSTLPAGFALAGIGRLDSHPLRAAEPVRRAGAPRL